MVPASPPGSADLLYTNKAHHAWSQHHNNIQRKLAQTACMLPQCLNLHKRTMAAADTVATPAGSAPVASMVAGLGVITACLADADAAPKVVPTPLLGSADLLYAIKGKHACLDSAPKQHLEQADAMSWRKQHECKCMLPQCLDLHKRLEGNSRHSCNTGGLCPRGMRGCRTRGHCLQGSCSCSTGGGPRPAAWLSRHVVHKRGNACMQSSAP